MISLLNVVNIDQYGLIMVSNDCFTTNNWMIGV